MQQKGEGRVRRHCVLNHWRPGWGVGNANDGWNNSRDSDKGTLPVARPSSLLYSALHPSFSQIPAARLVKHFLLFYDVSPDYLDRRTEFRSAHLEKARASSGRGELVLGGALVNPTDQAVLLFKAESAEVVKEFARSDPYVLNGLVTLWRVREWLTVAGEAATTPVQP